ncbi:MAG: hypothetical protein ACW99G_07905 [Candidatus Thorarchaeota archaeon]|jgi:hypothetical protein
MGVYDTYGEIQIKVGDVALRQYDVGDEVVLPDGVYVAPDGVVVIVGGVFVAEFKNLWDKWGSPIYPEDFVSWL